MLTIDDNDDGMVDGYWYIQADPQPDHQTTLLETRDALGGAIRRSNYGLDADGNVILFTHDLDADGTPETTITRSYDAQGRLVEQESTTGTSITHLTWSCDVDGLLSLETTSTGTMGDQDLTSHTYDGSGVLLRTDIDLGGDGSIDEVRTMINDAFGRKVGARLTDDVGLPLNRETWSYPGANDLVYDYTLDSTGDGVVNRIEHWEYLSDSQLALYEGDIDADGDLEYRTTYTWKTDEYWLTADFFADLGTSGPTLHAYELFYGAYPRSNGSLETTFDGPVASAPVESASRVEGVWSCY